MPHVIIYAKFDNLNQGPTFLANNDELLADFLGATKSIDNGPTSGLMISDPPYHVLDKLEQRGFRVVGMSSITAERNEQTFCWTLHKPEEIEPI